MVTEVKKKNWFRRHWIITIILGFFILGMIGSMFSEDSSNITGNVVNEQENIIEQPITEVNQEEVNVCVPDWKCSEWTSCFSGKQERVCVDKSDCGVSENKPMEKQTCIETTKEIKTGTQSDKDDSLEDWSDDFNQAMEDLDEALEDIKEQQDIYKKIDECTELCAGEDINIPVMKNECYSACYQIYYYGGEEALDEYIKELKET